MALLDEIVTENPAWAIGAGILALAVPVAVPSLRPIMRDVLKAGVTLFFEAEGEAEGQLIDSLVEAALDELAAVVASPPEERRAAARHVVRRFERAARRRAASWGWDEEDRSHRYRRHMRKLRHAVSRERDRQSGEHAALLDRLSSEIAEDW